LPVIYSVYYSSNYYNKFSKYGLKVILVLISFSLISTASIAQHGSIDVEEAIKLAKTNNLEYKNSILNVERQKAMVKTAWSLGKTEVAYTSGQLNSELVDYQWYIKQDFGLPFHQASNSNFMKLIVERTQAEQHLVSR